MDYLRKRMRIVHRSIDTEGTSIQTVNSSRSVLSSGETSAERLSAPRLTPEVFYRGVKMINKMNNSPIVDNLKYIQKNNILDLMKKNTYRGFRHKKGLPVRGQRTQTNRQTSKNLSRRVSHRAGAQRN
jgi:ribosomal protein S13